MSRGRICYLTFGTSIHMQRLVNYLAEQDWEVHLVTREPAPRSKLHRNVEQHALPNFAPKFMFPFTLLKLKSILKKIKPDVLHAHDIAVYGIYGAYSGFKPLMIHAWGFKHIKLHKGLQRRLEERTVREADIITMTTPELKNALMESFHLPEEKFRVFSWGIDTGIFRRGYDEEVKALREKLGIAEDARVVISSRHLDPLYGISDIIDAIPKVREHHPNTVFIILRGGGAEEYEREMMDKAKELGAADKTIFVQRSITPKEMAVYLNLSDVFVSVPVSDQESSSLLEGMACGSFPVVLDAVANRKWIRDGENGFLVPYQRPDLVAERVNSFLAHGDRFEGALEKNASDVRERMDWNKNIRTMEDLYRELMAKYGKGKD